MDICVYRVQAGFSLGVQGIDLRALCRTVWNVELELATKRSLVDKYALVRLPAMSLRQGEEGSVVVERRAVARVFSTGNVQFTCSSLDLARSIAEFIVGYLNAALRISLFEVKNFTIESASGRMFLRKKVRTSLSELESKAESFLTANPDLQGLAARTVVQDGSTFLVEAKVHSDVAKLKLKSEFTSIHIVHMTSYSFVYSVAKMLFDL